MHRTLRKPAALVLAAMAVAASADAAIVNMTTTNSNTGQNWNTTTAWTPAGVPVPANDYVVGIQNATTPFTVRKPSTNADETFPGGSLTLDGGQLNIQHTATGGTAGWKAIIADLRVQNGGIIVNANAFASLGLGGNLYFADAGPNWIRTGGSDSTTNARNIEVTSTITGGGIVGIAQGGTVRLTGAGNSFNGTWSVGGTNLNVRGALNSATDSSATRYPILKAASTGSLGTGSSVVLQSYGRLDVDYDWTTAGALTINTNALMTLDQDLSVGMLTVDGTSYGAGTYSFATLNASHDALFADGGSGSITVVPEPAAALSLLGLAGLALYRRRKA